jgi:putative PIN family toxin of toxin-antitoxin system
MRVVLDANVLASFLMAGKDSTTREMVKRCMFQEFEVVLSAYIQNELVGVLHKPYFQKYLSEQEKQEYLQIVKERSIFIDVRTSIVGVAPEPKDDPVICAAIDAQASHILTRDIPFINKGALIWKWYAIDVISPEEFLKILQR